MSFARFFKSVVKNSPSFEKSTVEVDGTPVRVYRCGSNATHSFHVGRYNDQWVVATYYYGHLSDEYLEWEQNGGKFDPETWEWIGDPPPSTPMIVEDGWVGCRVLPPGKEPLYLGNRR